MIVPMIVESVIVAAVTGVLVPIVSALAGNLLSRTKSDHKIEIKYSDGETVSLLVPEEIAKLGANSSEFKEFVTTHRPT